MIGSNSTLKNRRNAVAPRKPADVSKVPRFIASLNAMAMDAGLAVSTHRIFGNPDQLRGVWSGSTSRLLAMGIWAKSQRLPQRSGNLAVPMGDYRRPYTVISGTVEVDQDEVTYTIDFGCVPESIEQVGPVEITRYRDETAYHGTAEQLVEYGIDRRRLPPPKRNARINRDSAAPWNFGSRRWPDGTVVHWCETEVAMQDRLEAWKEREAEYAKCIQKREEARDSDLSPAIFSTVREWKAEHHNALSSWLRSLRFQWAPVPDLSDVNAAIYGERFRLADTDVWRIDSIIHQFTEELHAAIDQAAVIDREAPARPSHLRLAVDNTVRP
jgi:hypothetical protein